MIAGIATSLMLSLAPLGAAGSTAPADDLCARVPVARVSEVLAGAGLAVEHASAQPGSPEVCLYSFAGRDGGATVMMSWTRLPSEQAAGILISRHAKPMPNARPLDGVGSEAYIAETPGAVTLFVRQGNAYGQIQVSPLSGASPPPLAEAAQQLGRLLVEGAG